MPLDRDDPDSESLELQLAFEADPEAPRGLLLVLNGGPGAPAAPLATLFAERLGADVMAAYRLIAVDVRGTGPT